MIPLYKPFMPKLPELDNVLNSGQLAYGKYGKLLEAKLSDFIGNPYSLVTNNYSNAILLALLTLGIKKGDNVVISPLVCLATSQPLSSLGLNLVFCDINPNNGALDEDSLREILSKKKIDCVVFTHYAGVVGDIIEIRQLCKTYSVPVIEDASDAFGSKYQGNYIGNQGFDITVFSFSAVRNPNMIDSGGMSFGNKNLYEKAYLIRDAGIDRTKFRNEFGEIDLSNDIYLPGIGATLDEVRSYIGLKQLENIDYILSKSQTNMDQILRNLRQFQEIRNLLRVAEQSNGWVLPIHVPNKVEIIKALKDHGIMSSSVHSNIAYYSIYRNVEIFKNADEFLETFLAIPCGWWIEDLNGYIVKLNFVLSNILK